MVDHFIADAGFWASLDNMRGGIAYDFRQHFAQNLIRLRARLDKTLSDFGVAWRHLPKSARDCPTWRGSPLSCTSYEKSSMLRQDRLVWYLTFGEGLSPLRHQILVNIRSFFIH